MGEDSPTVGSTIPQTVYPELFKSGEGELSTRMQALMHCCLLLTADVT